MNKEIYILCENYGGNYEEISYESIIIIICFLTNILYFIFNSLGSFGTRPFFMLSDAYIKKDIKINTIALII